MASRLLWLVRNDRDFSHRPPGTELYHLAREIDARFDLPPGKAPEPVRTLWDDVAGRELRIYTPEPYTLCGEAAVLVLGHAFYEAIPLVFGSRNGVYPNVVKLPTICRGCMRQVEIREKERP